MIRATSALCALALAVPPLALLGAPSARAQAQPDYAAAKKHYLAGNEASGRKEFETAIHEYILAYDITKDPSLFRRIGAAYEGLGRRNEAVIYYRRYLSEAKTPPDADEIRGRIMTLSKAAAAPPAPAPAPAAEPAKPAPAPAAEPPKPAPEPVASSPRPVASTPKPAAEAPAPSPRVAAETAKPSLEPRPPEPPKLPPPESPTQASPDMRLSQPPMPSFADESGRWQRTAAWISVGLAAVGATTGAVLATSAKSREEDLQRLIDYRDPLSGQPKEYSGTTKDDYDSKVDEGQRLKNFATVAFIGAGACAAAATVFFILDATRSLPKEHAVVPTFGPNGGGLLAAWEF
jgi:hypothetical protein